MRGPPGLCVECRYQVPRDGKTPADEGHTAAVLAPLPLPLKDHIPPFVASVTKGGIVIIINQPKSSKPVPRPAFVTVSLGVLTALEIVLNRFLSINAWNLKIGFSFLPVSAAGMLFGPLAGGVVGALGDFLGAVLFPIGTYHPGFTLTAFLTGCVYGLFLRKNRGFLRVLGAVLVQQVVLSLFLNTLWLSQLYGTPYRVLLASRLVQCAVLVPVQLVVLRLLGGAAEKVEGRLCR